MDRSVIDLIDAGEIDALKAALARDPQLAAATDPNGLSALRHAVYHRRRDVIDAVLTHRDGDLEVFEAAALGDEKRIGTLLARDRLSAGAVAPDGFRPLHLAAYFGHPRIARALIDAGADVNAEARDPSRVRPLQSAVSGRHRGVVEILLDAGADPNPAQAHGWTALHSAAHQGNGPMIALLLEHGADRTVRADNGQRPADMAREAGYHDLADELERAVPG
ncbi:MAG: ankyrin repeat domain-containing protein [Candidatus Dormibacteraeota bacterium]|nr:ankyrin repeat domain-containing protein [Candidatus Dormibacteraeota bacterium]